MGNIENNDNDYTEEIVEEVTPSVSSGNDEIESSEISELATTEVVKAEATEEVAPTDTSAKESVPTASDLTKEIIQEKIKKSTRDEFETLWIPLIMENQTGEEISKESTVEKNRSGLNSYDSKNVTFWFENIKKGNHLTEGNVTILRKILPKYWNQYIEKALSDVEIATKMWNAGTSEEEIKSRGRGRPRKDDPEVSAETEAEVKARAEELRKKLETLVFELNEAVKKEHDLDAGIVVAHLYDIHTFIKYIYDKFGKTESKETINDIISLVEMGIINAFNRKQDGTITHIDDILIPIEFSSKFGSFRMTYEGVEELGFSEKRGPYSEFLTGCRCFINKVFINLDDESDKTVHLNLKIIDKTGREIEEEATLAEIMTPEGIKSFGAIGLDCTRKNANSLSAFLQSQYDLNLGRFETAYIVGSNGWKKDGSLVFGNVRYEEGGKKSIIRLTSESESDIMGGLGKKGSVIVYSKETKPFFNDRFVRSTMYFKTASMIAKLLNVGNKLKNVFGTSSHGKTLTEMLNASHEGNPTPQDKNGLLFSADNTKWRLEKLAAHRSGRCLYFDESNGVDPELVKHLVNGVGRGRRNPGKNKGTGNFDEERWNAFFIYSAEHPIIEENADMGAFVRIINSEVDNKETGIEVFEDTKRIARIKEKILPNNYGHIIEPLIETIFEYKSKLQEMYDTYYDKYSELIARNPVEQNRVQAYAITALGGFLFERTLEKINKTEGAEFDILNSDEIVEYYFEKEVCDTPIENTGLKELRRFVGWVNMNESSFLPTNSGKVEVVSSFGDDNTIRMRSGKNASLIRFGALRVDIDRLYIIPEALKAVFFKDNKNKEYLFSYLKENEAIDLVISKDKKGKETVNDAKPVRLLLGDKKTQRVYSIIWSKVNELIGNKFEEEPTTIAPNSVSIDGESVENDNNRQGAVNIPTIPKLPGEISLDPEDEA